MPLKLFAITLTLSGTIIMLAALHPAMQLWNAQRTGRQKNAWQILVVLMMLFVMAYVIFLAAIASHSVSTVDFVVSALMFGGSCFVILVLRISLGSIREVKLAAEQERYNALHDQLTKLPNRMLLGESVLQAIAHGKRRHAPLCLMIMDLNQFKEINDTLGHHIGDKLLQALVPRLQGAARESDLIARLGGDEFAILLTGTGREGAIAVSERIIQSLAEPLSVDSYDLKIGISMGVSQYPADGHDFDTLIKKAEIAMYAAKNGTNHIEVYKPSQNVHSIEKLNTTRKLHDAITKGRMSLHFQPIIDLQTRQVKCFEVLSRWFDEELGAVPPDEFIPIAEQTGLIKQLTLWMLDEAIRQCQHWQALKPDLHLSVNMTAQDLQDTYLIRNINDILTKHGFNAGQLHIEITESNMMTDSGHSRRVISQLHELGVSLSIDDFGTGFSSLAYLKQMPTQTIKIDKSFVSDIVENGSDEIIVRSVIDIAHNMGQVVIAEGIEDRACLERLISLNCDYGQGYFFSRPLPGEDVVPWLQERVEISQKAAM